MPTRYILDSDDIFRSAFWTDANLATVPEFVRHTGAATVRKGLVPAPPENTDRHVLLTHGWSFQAVASTVLTWDGAKAPVNKPLTDFVLSSSLGVASGVATLDSGGKLDPNQIPNKTIEVTTVVANQAARLALTIVQVQNGDRVFQTDTSTYWELINDADIPNAASWLKRSPVAWSEISNKPTTLAGFGITDGVINTRTISTTGLLTGGGNLTADRSFDVPAASDVETLWGYVVSKAVTPSNLRIRYSNVNALRIGVIADAVSGHGESAIDIQATRGSTSNFASGQGSVNVGSSGTASNVNTVNIGANGAATNDNSVNIGANGSASGVNAINIGTSGSANAPDAINIGYASQASGDTAIAIGTPSIAYAYCVSIGPQSQALGTSAISVGYFGYANNGAINVGISGSASNPGAINIGPNGSATGQDSINMGFLGQANYQWSMNFGYGGQANGYSAINIGCGGTAGTSGINLGVQGQAGTGAINIGVVGQASGTYSMSFGYQSLASGERAVSVGSFCYNTTNYCSQVASPNSGNNQGAWLRLYGNSGDVVQSVIVSDVPSTGHVDPQSAPEGTIPPNSFHFRVDSANQLIAEGYFFGYIRTLILGTLTT